MKLTEVTELTTHRVLVFGAPKSGKTELVGRAAEKMNLEYFDLENGHNTMRKFPIAWQERINLHIIPDTKDYPIAIETMLKIIKGSPVELCIKHGKIGCLLCKKDGSPQERICLNETPDDTIVVIDSLTQLSNSAMNHLLRAEPDTYKPEWTDYRSQGALLDRFLSNCQQATFNLCCITHESTTEMEDGKEKLVPLAGTTNFSRNSAKYFDHVVHCDVSNRKHHFHSSTTDSTRVLTGSRTDIDMGKNEAPNILDIFQSRVTRTESKAVSNLKNLLGKS